MSNDGSKFILQDYVGNKRLELSGQLISLLFEVLFKITIIPENISLPFPSPFAI